MTNLLKSLIQAQAEFPTVPKDKIARAGKFNYKYADLAIILKIIMPILCKHGLGITQYFEGNNLVTKLFHTSGEYIESKMILEYQSMTSQEIGSMITYMRRYNICLVLGIVADDDDDGAQAQVCSKPVVVRTQAPVDPPIDLASIKQEVDRIGWSYPQLSEYLMNTYGVKKVKELSKEKFDELLNYLKNFKGEL